MEHFNPVDIAILAILSISLILGLTRGLLREVLSLVIWVAAFVVAVLFANRAALAFYNPVTTLELGISFACLFIATLFIGWIISLIIRAITGKLEIGFFNRFMGGLLGLARGCFILLAGIFLIELTSWADTQQWHESKFVNRVQPMMDRINATMQPRIQNLKDKIKNESAPTTAKLNNE